MEHWILKISDILVVEELAAIASLMLAPALLTATGALPRGQEQGARLPSR